MIFSEVIPTYNFFSSTILAKKRKEFGLQFGFQKYRIAPRYLWQ
jgi:hypothetical protein